MIQKNNNMYAIEYLIGLSNNRAYWTTHSEMYEIRTSMSASSMSAFKSIDRLIANSGVLIQYKTIQLTIYLTMKLI